MNEFDFSVGVGYEYLVDFYLSGKVMSVKENIMHGTKGEEIKWYQIQILTDTKKNLVFTIAANVNPLELESIEKGQIKDYDFGIQIQDEKDKRGNYKYSLKVVYVIEKEDGSNF